MWDLTKQFWYSIRPIVIVIAVSVSMFLAINFINFFFVIASIVFVSLILFTLGSIFNDRWLRYEREKEKAKEREKNALQK